MKNRSVKDAEWVRFEQAVADFASAIDPNAKVTHNLSEADRHTGLPRQRDVWIETTFGGLCPIRMLVSCKAYKRKLNQQDIDAFAGELQSSHANKGVIFSTSGFGAAALAKAAKLGICCCQLVDGIPPELPELLTFSCYCAMPRCEYSFRKPIPTEFAEVLVGSLFETAIIVEGGTQSGTVFNRMQTAYRELEALTIADQKRNALEPLRAYSTTLTVDGINDGESLHINLTVSWRYFKADVNAYLVDGAYNLTSNTFVGEQRFPSIDMRNPASPGSGWEPIEALPNLLSLANVVLVVFHGSQFVESRGQRTYNKLIGEL